MPCGLNTGLIWDREAISAPASLLFNLCTEMIKVQTVLFECCAAVSMITLIFRLPALLGIIECFEEHHKSDHCPIISCRETVKDSVAVCKLVKQTPEPTRVRAVNRGHKNGTSKEVCVFRLCYDGDTIFIS